MKLEAVDEELHENLGTYVMRCAIWYQSLFGVCMVVRMHTNAFFYLNVVFIRLHELDGILTGLSNVKRLNAIQTGKH